ncbi:type II secretion system F family protein [Paenibacillus sp. LHD-117]|uniref:type II secretion system F family protein n=1 Tax=Paenibacillus sp. LHD-117 TaxID=3071412 RepID=UPI0027DF1AB2|nr:type II secretion system F family protein [Paenibacillus sp. LHD-117]MDQ6420322.1 type II secretion system F family protein [Paenibacillus sp. LHD-117]
MKAIAWDNPDSYWRRALRRCGWEAVFADSGRDHPNRSMLEDYTSYRMSRKQVAASVLIGSAVLFAAFYLFYHSIVVSAIAAIAGAAAPRIRQASLLRQRRNRLKLQFKEMLFSLASSLAAGRSVENAFRAALEDLSLLYSDSYADMLKELRVIHYRLDQSVTLEEAVRDFARRAGIDEITMFADTLTACKRSGGDLLEVMKRTSAMIGEKMSVDSEILVLMAQKRFEASVMMAVPFVFLGFLGFAAPDYMAPLYAGFGYVLLTFALLLLAGCFWLIFKIMSIEM